METTMTTKKNVAKNILEAYGCVLDDGKDIEPSLFAGLRELYPKDFELLKQDERVLGFTLDNKSALDMFIGDACSCVYHGDEVAVRNLVTGKFSVDDIYVDGEWRYPAGVFHGAEGEPC